MIGEGETTEGLIEKEAEKTMVEEERTMEGNEINGGRGKERKEEKDGGR